MIDRDAVGPSLSQGDRIVPKPGYAASSRGASLTSRTMHGLKWSYVDTAINAILQIGYSAIMARLLTPDAFGLVAMGNVVLRFGSYFAQMGMGQALVQRKELSKEDIRAAFTSSVTLGVLAFVVIWIAAPLALHLFDSPNLILLTRVMALSFVLTGFSITALSLLRRDLAFRTIAILDITSFALGYGLGGICLAMRGFGVWGLVAASLSQAAILAASSVFLTRHRLGFVHRWRYFKPLYAYGGRVSIISFMEFISTSLDTLVIGRYLGSPALGVYNRAFMLINLPMQYLGTSFARVIMPSYSRIQSDMPRLRLAYLSSITLMGSLLIPLCWGAAAASEELVLVVLGEQWRSAVPVLRVLAIATPFSLLSVLAGSLLDATAELKAKMLIQAPYIALLCILFVSLGGLGLVGFAAAATCGEVIRHALYGLVTKRVLEISGRQFVSAYQPGIMLGAAIGLLISCAGSLLRQATVSTWAAFVVEVAAGGIVLILLFSFAGWLAGPRREIVQRLSGSGIESSVGSRAITFLTRMSR